MPTQQLYCTYCGHKITDHELATLNHLVCGIDDCTCSDIEREILRKDKEREKVTQALTQLQNQIHAMGQNVHDVLRFIKEYR